MKTVQKNKNARIVLDMSAVLDIRRLALEKDRISNTQLSRIYGVTEATIRKVITRQTWKNVPQPAVVYPGYQVYSDGRVYSEAKNTFMTVRQTKDGPAVRVFVKTKNLVTRKTFTIQALLEKAYG